MIAMIMMNTILLLLDLEETTFLFSTRLQTHGMVAKIHLCHRQAYRADFHLLVQTFLRGRVIRVSSSFEARRERTELSIVSRRHKHSRQAKMDAGRAGNGNKRNRGARARAGASRDRRRSSI